MSPSAEEIGSYGGVAADHTADPDRLGRGALASAYRFDLLLLDVHMPGPVSAAELWVRMRETLPDTRIVIVTAFDGSDEIRACLAAGADGCLLNDTSEVDMTAALRTVLTGGCVIDSRIAFPLARELAGQRLPARSPQLTPGNGTCSTSSPKAAQTVPSPADWGCPRRP